MDNETYRAELFHEPAPNNVNMPWTIERQLEAYAMHPDATERHKILLDSWRQLSVGFRRCLDIRLHLFRHIACIMKPIARRYYIILNVC